MSQACGEGAASHSARRSRRNRDTVCAHASIAPSRLMSLAEAGYTYAVLAGVSWLSQQLQEQLKAGIRGACHCLGARRPGHGGDEMYKLSQCVTMWDVILMAARG